MGLPTKSSCGKSHYENLAPFFQHWVENEDRVGSYVLLFNSRKTKGCLSVITYDILLYFSGANFDVVTSYFTYIGTFIILLQ